MLSAVLVPGARKDGCFREVAVVYNDCCISTCSLWWGEVIREEEQGGGVSACTNLTCYSAQRRKAQRRRAQRAQPIANKMNEDEVVRKGQTGER